MPEEEVAHPSPKLERPRSLSIQISVDEHDKKEEMAAGPPENGEVHEETVEEKKDETAEVEEKMGDLEINVAEKTPESVDGGAVGRKTPHLTDQGFFDLKFYHNKLW